MHQVDSTTLPPGSRAPLIQSLLANRLDYVAGA